MCFPGRCMCCCTPHITIPSQHTQSTQGSDGEQQHHPHTTPHPPRRPGASPLGPTDRTLNPETLRQHQHQQDVLHHQQQQQQAVAAALHGTPPSSSVASHPVSSPGGGGTPLSMGGTPLSGSGGGMGGGAITSGGGGSVGGGEGSSMSMPSASPPAAAVHTAARTAAIHPADSQVSDRSPYMRNDTMDSLELSDEVYRRWVWVDICLYTSVYQVCFLYLYIYAKFCPTRHVCTHIYCPSGSFDPPFPLSFHLPFSFPSPFLSPAPSFHTHRTSSLDMEEAPVKVGSALLKAHTHDLTGPSDD